MQRLYALPKIIGSTLWLVYQACACCSLPTAAAMAAVTWLLGRQRALAHPADNPLTDSPSDAVIEQPSLLWITYRKGMVLQADRPAVSDAGWGCTLRSTQGLLANTLARFLPKLEVLQCLADLPARPFGLQALLSHSSKPPGVWFGPWEACALAAHAASAWAGGPQDDGSATASDAPPATWPAACPFGVLLATDGLVSTSDIQEAAEHGAAHSTWTRPVLLLVPLRLGLSSPMHPAYLYQLLRCFECPQSAGAVGGSPGHSVYFVGTGPAAPSWIATATAALLGEEPSNSNGSGSGSGTTALRTFIDRTSLLCLDPHTVQSNPMITDDAPYTLPEAYVQSTRLPGPPARMSPHKIDPTVAVAFLFMTAADVDAWKQHMESVYAECDAICSGTMTAPSDDRSQQEGVRADAAAGRGLRLFAITEALSQSVIAYDPSTRSVQEGSVHSLRGSGTPSAWAAASVALSAASAAAPASPDAAGTPVAVTPGGHGHRLSVDSVADGGLYGSTSEILEHHAAAGVHSETVLKAEGQQSAEQQAQEEIAHSGRVELRTDPHSAPDAVAVEAASWRRMAASWMPSVSSNMTASAGGGGIGKQPRSKDDSDVPSTSWSWPGASGTHTGPHRASDDTASKGSSRTPADPADSVPCTGSTDTASHGSSVTSSLASGLGMGFTSSWASDLLNYTSSWLSRVPPLTRLLLLSSGGHAAGGAGDAHASSIAQPHGLHTQAADQHEEDDDDDDGDGEWDLI